MMGPLGYSSLGVLYALKKTILMNIAVSRKKMFLDWHKNWKNKQERRTGINKKNIEKRKQRRRIEIEMKRKKTRKD